MTQQIMLMNFCRRIGALRCGLALITLLVISAAPFADGTTHLDDWRLFPSVIAPTLMMILIFVLSLDITMARTFMADAGEDKRNTLRIAIRFESILLLLMLLAWLPFVLKILDLSPFD